jgi:hypothetical protein
MRLYGGKGNSAPPPDPRLIEAQIRSMGIQDDVIKRIMQQSEDMLPLQKEQLQFGLDSSRTAYDQSQEDRTWMLDRRGALTTMQDTLTQDARSFNTEDKANELAGKAMADVNQGFANAEGQQSRALARMGVNPSSGKALAMGNQTAIAKATALAAAGTGARDRARTEGYALTDRATNALSGYPAMGMQATGAGAGFGASGINLSNQGLAGMNSGFGAAGTMAGQMGQNATNMFGAQASYKNQQDQIAASSNPMGALLGAGAQLGAAAIGKYSDRRLKQNIELVGRDERTGLSLYEFAYKDAPHERWRGVMADEVLQVMPSAVHTNEEGFMSVDYGALGIEVTQVGETP